MSRGREAVRAANRRTEEARAEAETLRTELAGMRSQHDRERRELKAEIKQLVANQVAEASRLAAVEVTRRLAEKEEERRRRGISDDIAQNNLYLKDMFVYRACRYVSMTTGQSPFDALSMVMTWMTGEDFYGFTNVEVIAKLGLPSDGWVARYVRHNQHDFRRVARKRVENDEPAAISLDRAESERHERIHPAYNPRWYPPIDYRVGIEVIDDEPAAAR